ncbi:cadherin-related family member 5-like [Acipenser oxyrinchus oxyrinchus]|uniref:Cadherin-related family member 5-like n=1 Tax=Acipenser oxyrinchus oxyrinchus TaxID=40147 RepID=A0AAD8CZY9_ACIOX|nr:cadherin-related family member 5-like [Acipenser oxyrinchus oxyrinchus]
MDLKWNTFPAYGAMLLLLLSHLHTKCDAQTDCWSDMPKITSVEENNPIGFKLGNISTEAGVTLAKLEDLSNSFGLENQTLFLTKALDFEATTQIIDVIIACQRDGNTIGAKTLTFSVAIENVNDNSPQFDQAEYVIPVKELLPLDTIVARIVATDADKDQLFYHFGETTDGYDYFQLVTQNSPNITIKKVIDYDTATQLKLILFARDTPVAEQGNTATATITVIVQDVDNRPPWFQPCQQLPDETTKICLSSGYTGNVNLTEKADGPLPLDPGPLYAIDGDVGINTLITYTIVSGNEHKIFAINPDSGNITMTKAADLAGPITLSVMAAQANDRNKFALTTVTINILKKSAYPPVFEVNGYEGLVPHDAEVGSMVLQVNSFNKPLRVSARDQDFGDGVNPDLEYKVQGSTDFIVTKEGYVLINKKLTPGQLNVMIIAEDTTNLESATANIHVEVQEGLTSTSMPPTTLEITETSTTPLPDTTSNSPSTTSHAPITSHAPTTSPSQTSGQTSAALSWSPSSSPALTTPPPKTEGAPVPKGGFSSEDMAALGASLAVLLVLCMAIIGVLVFKIHKGKKDWEQLSQTSLVRNTFGRDSLKKKPRLQFDNEGYNIYENANNSGTKVPDEPDNVSDHEPDQEPKQKPDQPTHKDSVTFLENEVALSATAMASILKADTSSQDGSEDVDSDKEIKSILTKERKNDEEYKSVWFKEDIVPDAKEDVLIIENDLEVEDEEDLDEGDESSDDDKDDHPDSPRTKSKVFFEDPPTGVDIGPKVAFEDPANASTYTTTEI